jgi:hypothetical protein
MRDRLVLPFLLLIGATAAADVPIHAERVEIGSGFVTIAGSSAPRAKVRAFDGGSCEGDAVGVVRAGRGGSWSMKLRTNGEPPYLVSLQAVAGGEASACLGGTIERPEEEQAVSEPEPDEYEDEVAPAPPQSKPERPGAGMCIGVSTRCGLLPKGVCFMQAGCYNPYIGDRCEGSAKACTSFYTESACYTQRGCIWTK